ncbi:MAG: hypothetical protein GX802_02560 [Clostridiales bacterium]|nr:hypothetical protein [Clostridiales bacterium]
MLIVINRFESEINKQFSVQEIATFVSDEYLSQRNGRYELAKFAGASEEFDAYTHFDRRIAENTSEIRYVTYNNQKILKCS